MRQLYWAVRTKKTGKLLGVEAEGNPDSAEFCGSYRAYFSTYNTTPHLFENEEQAKKALFEDTPWYNSGLHCPGWGSAFESAEEVEVVKVNLILR